MTATFRAAERPFPVRRFEFRFPVRRAMHVFELTRALIDIDSVTPNEFEIGNFLYDYLRPLAENYDGLVERSEVGPRRNNVFARWGDDP